MNDSFESDERKRKETIECLYWSLMNGWDIPKDIREHYGFSEDYELYHRLESMEPEDYRERRLRGEIPDAIEVDVRLTHAVEKVFERLCSLLPCNISTSCKFPDEIRQNSRQKRHVKNFMPGLKPWLA